MVSTSATKKSHERIKRRFADDLVRFTKGASELNRDRQGWIGFGWPAFGAPHSLPPTQYP